MNTPRHTLGLVLFALLSVGDLATPLLTNGEHPPMSIALAIAALGVASLVCLPAAWRGGRTALLGLLATRLVSGLLTLPAFVMDDVPAAGLATAILAVALTVLGSVLVLTGARRTVAAA